jgi:o-succinylbenzoate synthase
VSSLDDRTLPDATIQLLELVRVELPMVVPFRTSFGVQTTREALLVHVVTDEAEGWGECVTPAAPVYSEEYTDGAADVLRRHLVPRLLGSGSTVDARDVRDRLAGIKGHRMAKAALEVAVLDAQLRAAGIPLARHLGATSDRVPAGVSVGIPDGGTSELLDLVAGYLDEGYLRIKAKVARGHDVTPMAALRARFGDELALQVDANAGYDPDDPDDVAPLDGLDELGSSRSSSPSPPTGCATTRGTPAGGARRSASTSRSSTPSAPSTRSRPAPAAS